MPNQYCREEVQYYNFRAIFYGVPIASEPYLILQKDIDKRVGIYYPGHLLNVQVILLYTQGIYWPLLAIQVIN